MRKIITPSLFLALTLASTALAADTLFPTNARLDTTVSLVAGKPARVECYNSDTDWNNRVQTVFSGTRTGPQINAFTFPGTSVTEVSPAVCRTVYYALRVGQAKVGTYQLSRALDVIAHEPQHMVGIRSEASAEACSHRYVALVAHTLLGVKYHTARMRFLINAALIYSVTLPPEYQGGSCPR